MESFRGPDSGLAQTKQSQNKNEGKMPRDSFKMLDLLSAITLMRRTRDYNIGESLIKLGKKITFREGDSSLTAFPAVLKICLLTLLIAVLHV